MKTSNTQNTTGHLKAQIDDRTYNAESVDFYLLPPVIIAGAPLEGAEKEGMFFSLPADIEPGKYELNQTSGIEAWYNPGQHQNSWIADGSQGYMKIISVSTENDPLLEISFSFVAVNRADTQQRKTITGEARFEGVSQKGNAHYKIE